MSRKYRCKAPLLVAAFSVRGVCALCSSLSSVDTGSEVVLHVRRLDLLLLSQMLLLIFRSDFIQLGLQIKIVNVILDQILVF